MREMLRILTRPLWAEDAAYRAGRRLRQALVTPVMVLAGAVWGILASPAAGEAPGWAAGGALAFSLVAWMYLELQPLVLHLGGRAAGRAAWLAPLLWDWLVVGGVAFLLTDVLGIPTFRAVTTAVVVGGTYGLFVAAFFDEEGSRLLGGLFFAGWGRAAAPFSGIEALMARGEHEAALAAAREFVRLHPDDPRGWITLGRLLGRAGEPLQALRALREGIERAPLTVEQEQRYLHEIVRVCEAEGSADLAAADLERFVAARTGTLQAEWARAELERIGGGTDVSRNPDFEKGG